MQRKNVELHLSTLVIAKLLLLSQERNVSARDFDWALLNLIGGEFAMKFGADPART
jgi:hypothetical protein